MSLISAGNLSLSFTDKPVLKDITFSVEAREKIGLIGANGAGKSTLFKIITGEYVPSSGFVNIQKDCTISYMEQHACSNSKRTVFDELLSIFEPLFKIERELADINQSLDENSPDFNLMLERGHFLNLEYERLGGLTYLSRARSALIGMGFTEDYFDRPVELLSGGEKSKLSLCKLLLSGADFLLLDEPTNHLDIAGIEWLENWLIEYRGTFIVISHDRYFLDKVTNKTIELENGRAFIEKGNYTRYIELKKERQKTEQRSFDASMKEIRRIEGIIEQQKRFNRERNYITIASKQKSIDRILENIETPEKEQKGIRFSFKSSLISGNDVLLLKGIKKSFDEEFLFENVDLDLKREERCFIVGDNGCGKSTLLKIILNKTTRDSGRIVFGTGVKIGYFDQTLAELSSNKTALDEVWDSYRQLSETEIRSALALFLFKGDDVYKSMSSLSGGEKARIALLKLMLSKANFLVLDEPTNNLDIKSRQALEDALNEYDGTMLIVSHDRYFINSLATRILHLKKDGLESFVGNYDDYFSKKQETENEIVPVKDRTNTYKRQKEYESLKRRLAGKISRIEKEIEETDERINELQALISDPDNSSDYERIISLTDKLNSMIQFQNERTDEWERLSIELEELSEGENYG